MRRRKGDEEEKEGEQKGREKKERGEGGKEEGQEAHCETLKLTVGPGSPHES